MSRFEEWQMSRENLDPRVRNVCDRFKRTGLPHSKRMPRHRHRWQLYWTGQGYFDHHLGRLETVQALAILRCSALMSPLIVKPTSRSLGR